MTVMEELVRVAEATGHVTPGSIQPGKRIETTRGLAPEFKTSMLQDIEAGREPEVRGYCHIFMEGGGL